MNETPPPVALPLGPGSQPDEEGAPPDLPLPGAMHTFSAPVLPEPEETAGLGPALARLESLLQALRRPAAVETVQRIELHDLDAANRAFVDQALGEGEVSLQYAGTPRRHAQESVLAGVWRVQETDAAGRLLSDAVEVGPAPACAGEAFATARDTLDTRCDPADGALQNAPALLVELADRLARYRPGDPVHTLNLTLLPLTEGDLALLGERLGVGPVTLLSRGYGNCRIGSTACANVWWIKYYNAQERLILNTIEVTDLPLVAQAAAEDLADSAERLDEILALYR